MFFAGMKLAQYRAAQGIQIFYFPLPDSDVVDSPYREAFIDNLSEGGWRWRDDGSLLSSDKHMAIEAEIRRRDVEYKLKKAGV